MKPHFQQSERLTQEKNTGKRKGSWVFIGYMDVCVCVCVQMLTYTQQILINECPNPNRMRESH